MRSFLLNQYRFCCQFTLSENGEIEMAKIIIHVEEHECNALDQLAEREYRTLLAQAALMLRKELERLGFLPGSEGSNTSESYPAIESA